MTQSFDVFFDVRWTVLNSRETGHLRHHGVHCNATVIVMNAYICISCVHTSDQGSLLLTEINPAAPLETVSTVLYAPILKLCTTEPG